VVPTLAQLETQYGDNVQLVLRDDPMDQLHPGARQAHEAARCTQEQGKF
jgi:protein-disulfide isomerase